MDEFFLQSIVIDLLKMKTGQCKIQSPVSPENFAEISVFNF